MVDRLWAPWRFKYIRNAEKPTKCFFCDYAKAPKSDSKNLVVVRGQTAFCVMNKFPYSVGHLMVAPYKHTSNLMQLSSNVYSEIMELITVSTSILKQAMKSQGFNIGANLGRVAGAGVPGHLHFHIVPRWKGDTNFISVLSDTRIMNDYFESTYSRLKESADILSKGNK